MKKINPFLWFDSEAEQAARFYVGIFRNSKIGKITHYGEDGPRPKGSVMTVEFTLDRVDFVALNPESVRGKDSSITISKSAKERPSKWFPGLLAPASLIRPISTSVVGIISSNCAIRISSEN